MYPKHMSTRICEQNPLLPPIAIGNVEKFIHACKIIETLETDVRLPLSIVAGTEAGAGASWRFFPTRRVRTSESASKLSCIR